jgi:hypothetical protein
VAIRVTDNLPTTPSYRPRIDLLRARALRAEGDTILHADRARTAYREKSAR